jgi:hypothetical protein
MGLLSSEIYDYLQLQPRYENINHKTVQTQLIADYGPALTFRLMMMMMMISLQDCT